MQTLPWKAAPGCARRGVCLGKGDRSPNAAIFRSLLVVHHSRNRSGQPNGLQGRAWGNQGHRHSTNQQNIHWSPWWLMKTRCNIFVLFGVRYLKLWLRHTLQLKRNTTFFKELVMEKKFTLPISLLKGPFASLFLLLPGCLEITI